MLDDPCRIIRTFDSSFRQLLDIREELVHRDIGEIPVNHTCGYFISIRNQRDDELDSIRLQKISKCEQCVQFFF